MTVTFLELIDLFGRAGTFLLYAVLTLAAVLFTAVLVPETKGAQPGGNRGCAFEDRLRRRCRAPFPRPGGEPRDEADCGTRRAACPAVAAPAVAQTSDADPTQGDAQRFGAGCRPQVNAARTSEHLFGDWGSARTYLEDRGIYLSFDALTEFAGNVSGGVKQGATAANQIAFGADIDWQRLAGIQGFSTHVILVNRTGANDSTLFGDNLLPVQEIYGAGGNVVVHLVSIYAQEKLFDGRLDIAAGHMNVENDFASSPLYCNYMNNVLCGDPKALPGGDIGHSAYPDGVWGGRVRIRPTLNSYFTTGVYEVSQGLYGNDFLTALSST